MKKKFLITGPLRTGTTFLSTLINSQDDACCFEIALNSIKDIKDERDKILFNATVKYIQPSLTYFDIPLPIIETSPISKEKIIEFLSNHFANYYKVNNFGFKKTLISQEKLLMFKKMGFKIIVMRRNIEDQFFSYLHNRYRSPLLCSLRIKDYLKSIDYYEFKKLNPEDFIVVDFEDLLKANNKEITLKKISKYLGFKIDYNKPLMADFSKNLTSPIVRKWEKNSSYIYSKFLSPNYKDRKKNYKIYTDFILNKNFNLKLNFVYLIMNLKKVLMKLTSFT